MARLKEQIAQHTSAQTTQQQLPDDPLAPTPIRFTHQRGADEVLHKRTVNGPAAGWHLEDGAEGSDAEPPPRGQNATSSRQTRDHQQQARVTQACQIPAHHAAPCATSTRCLISTGGRPCSQLPQSTCAASVSPEMLLANSHVLLNDGTNTGRCTW